MTLLIVLLIAQVQVTIAPPSKGLTERLLSKRVARVALKRTVGLLNNSPDPVAVSESAVIVRIPQLAPFDHATMTLIIADAAKNSGWARAGRLSLDSVALAAFLGTSKPGLPWGQPMLFALSSVPVAANYIVPRLKGADIPVQQNFEAMSWIAPIALQPGETGIGAVFTDVDAPRDVVKFTIDTGGMVAAKVVK